LAAGVETPNRAADKKAKDDGMMVYARSIVRARVKGPAFSPALVG